MSNNIFKFINGKFVLTEGYGSVRKNVDEGPKPGTVRGPKREKNATPNPPGAAAARSEMGLPAGGVSAAPSEQPASEQPASEQPAPEAPATATASPETPPQASPDESPEVPATATPEKQDLTTFVGFAKAAGIKDKAGIESLIQKVFAWARTKNIAFDQNKLKAGMDSMEAPAATPTTPEAAPAVAAESKYYSPNKKPIIRHPSLVSVGYYR